MPPFLLGVTMRLLLPLLLFPSLSYATCHPGVNYGQYPIGAGNPVCAPYSGSSLGGCSALCGGSAGSSVCVEFPNASPPTKGPYITDGHECTYKDGSESGSYGNSGGNPSGVDGTHESPTGLVDVGQILVGDKLTTDFGVGFNSVSNNINKSATKIQKSVKDLAKQLEDARGWDNANYMDVFKTELQKISYNTSGIGSAGSNGNHELSGYLKSLYDQTVADSIRTETYRNKFIDRFDSLAHSVSLIPTNANGSGGGNGTTAADWQNLRQQLDSLDSWQRIHAHDLSQMQLYLSGISSSTNYIAQLVKDSTQGPDTNGDGIGDGLPEKPCTGPLCTFTPPSSSGSGSESGLSSVFSEKDIEGIKQKVADRKSDIQGQMDEVRKVFSPGKLEISGTYDNDYQDIHGARVDLSGKSNLELFFSLGPKQVLWFLAVLIAFGILLGGRKDA